ncbi:Avirulence (Avh) protein, partial [Phytophthora megakarya]
MRLHYVLVLSVVALLAPTNATLGSKVSTINFSARQLYRHSNDVPTKRRLRSHDNYEERVSTIKTGTERISKSAQNVLGRYSDDLSVKQTTVFKTLQARYSDAKLSELLLAGKRIQSTEKLAVELQKQQIRVWMDTFEHPETVFKLLMLDKAGENVLSNPQLKVWIDYAFSFKQHTKGNPLMKQTTLIDTLMKNYDDKALAIIIDTAKKSSNAKLMGSYVESALLGKWAIDNKPLGYVVKILGTTADEKQLVRTQYLENLGKLKNVEDKKVRGWLYNLESPDTVFKLLKLDQDNNLLTSPLLDEWVNYARAFKDRTKGNAAITQ